MARSRRTKKEASLIERTRVRLAPVPGDRPAPIPDAEARKHLDVPLLRDWRDLLRWDWILALLLRLLRWHRLDFMMQYQQQTNWCWAAVATSVALFYDPASTWTQCAVANGELGRSDCCGTGASGPCNVYGFLGSSLTRVGHLDHSTGSTTSFAGTAAEIDGGRPLCLRTAWSGGGAHFLAIIGYRTLGNMLAVDDPWYGKSDVAYGTFTTSYQGSGSWTHSYFTQA
jgi:hypothetical protein